jgi:hypothetical protein
MLVQGAPQIRQSAQADFCEGTEPLLGKLAEWSRIEIVELGTSAPKGDDKVGLLKNVQVLGDRLPGHGSAVTKVAEGLTVPALESGKQMPSSRI